MAVDEQKAQLGGRSAIAVALAVGYGAALIVAWVVAVADAPPGVTYVLAVGALGAVAWGTIRFILRASTGAMTRGGKDVLFVACGVSAAFVSWLAEADSDGWLVPAMFGVLPVLLAVALLTALPEQGLALNQSWRRELLLAGVTAFVAIVLILAGTATNRPGATGLPESVSTVLLVIGAGLLLSAGERAWAGLELWKKGRYLTTQ